MSARKPVHAPSAWQIEQAMTVLLSARARMQEDPDLAGDDVQIAAILESDPDTSDCFDLLHRVARAALHAEDMADAAKKRVAEIAGRQRRFANREQTLRGIMFAALEALGNPRIEQPDFSAYTSAGRAGVFITDETALPDAFVKTERSPMKKEIGDALRGGALVPGAELANGLPTLTIRRT